MESKSSNLQNMYQHSSSELQTSSSGLGGLNKPIARTPIGENQFFESFFREGIAARVPDGSLQPSIARQVKLLQTFTISTVAGLSNDFMIVHKPYGSGSSLVIYRIDLLSSNWCYWTEIPCPDALWERYIRSRIVNQVFSIFSSTRPGGNFDISGTLFAMTLAEIPFSFANATPSSSAPFMMDYNTATELVPILEGVTVISPPRLHSEYELLKPVTPGTAIPYSPEFTTNSLTTREFSNAANLKAVTAYGTPGTIATFSNGEFFKVDFTNTSSPYYDANSLFWSPFGAYSVSFHAQDTIQLNLSRFVLRIYTYAYVGGTVANFIDIPLRSTGNTYFQMQSTFVGLAIAQTTGGVTPTGYVVPVCVTLNRYSQTPGGVEGPSNIIFGTGIQNNTTFQLTGHYNFEVIPGENLIRDVKVCTEPNPPVIDADITYGYIKAMANVVGSQYVYARSDFKALARMTPQDLFLRQNSVGYAGIFDTLWQIAKPLLGPAAGLIFKLFEKNKKEQSKGQASSRGPEILAILDELELEHEAKADSSVWEEIKELDEIPLTTTDSVLNSDRPEGSDMDQISAISLDALNEIGTCDTPQTLERSRLEDSPPRHPFTDTKLEPYLTRAKGVLRTLDLSNPPEMDYPICHQVYLSVLPHTHLVCDFTEANSTKFVQLLMQELDSLRQEHIKSSQMTNQAITEKAMSLLTQYSSEQYGTLRLSAIRNNLLLAHKFRQPGYLHIDEINRCTQAVKDILKTYVGFASGAYVPNSSASRHVAPVRRRFDTNLQPKVALVTPVIYLAPTNPVMEVLKKVQDQSPIFFTKIEPTLYHTQPAALLTGFEDPQLSVVFNDNYDYEIFHEDAEFYASEAFERLAEIFDEISDLCHDLTEVEPSFHHNKGYAASRVRMPSISAGPNKPVEPAEEGEKLDLTANNAASKLPQTQRAAGSVITAKYRFPVITSTTVEGVTLFATPERGLHCNGLQGTSLDEMIRSVEGWSEEDTKAILASCSEPGLLASIAFCNFDVFDAAQIPEGGQTWQDFYITMVKLLEIFINRMKCGQHFKSSISNNTFAYTFFAITNAGNQTRNTAYVSGQSWFAAFTALCLGLDAHPYYTGETSYGVSLISDQLYPTAALAAKVLHTKTNEAPLVYFGNMTTNVYQELHEAGYRVRGLIDLYAAGKSYASVDIAFTQTPAEMCLTTQLQPPPLNSNKEASLSQLVSDLQAQIEALREKKATSNFAPMLIPGLSNIAQPLNDMFGNPINQQRLAKSQARQLKNTANPDSRQGDLFSVVSTNFWNIYNEDKRKAFQHAKIPMSPHLIETLGGPDNMFLLVGAGYHPVNESTRFRQSVGQGIWQLYAKDPQHFIRLMHQSVNNEFNGVENDQTNNWRASMRYLVTTMYEHSTMRKDIEQSKYEGITVGTVFSSINAVSPQEKGHNFLASAGLAANFWKQFGSISSDERVFNMKGGAYPIIFINPSFLESIYSEPARKICVAAFRSAQNNHIYSIGGYFTILGGLSVYVDKCVYAAQPFTIQRGSTAAKQLNIGQVKPVEVAQQASYQPMKMEQPGYKEMVIEEQSRQFSPDFPRLHEDPFRTAGYIPENRQVYSHNAPQMSFASRPSKSSMQQSYEAINTGTPLGQESSPYSQFF